MITPLPEAAIDSSPTRSSSSKFAGFVRRWWWVWVLVVALTALAAYNSTRQTDTSPMGLGNHEAGGAMALGNILRDQGVDIVEASSLVELERYADGDTTVFLLGWLTLEDAEREAIAALSADVVIAGSPYDSLVGLTNAVETSPIGTNSPTTAQCADPDASAASRISSSTGGVERTGMDVVELCFPSQDGAGLFAAWQQSGHTWRYIADVSIGSNERLDSDGNAALMLRSLGENQRLVWFEHRLTPESVGGGATALPPWGEPALAIGAVTLFAAALWQGRRMGRVVIEPLPVVVLPGEAVRGRARLYRASKSIDHAARSLRAGSISRLVNRLGLGHQASPDSVISLVSSTSGRPYDRVGPLLYGAAPATEKDLVTLANELAILEREVHP